MTHPGGGSGTGPGGGSGTGPGRCASELPHGPHRVQPRRTWTAFQCPGYDPAEFERQLTAAFGPEAPAP